MCTVVSAFFDLQKREGSTRRDASFYLENGRKLCQIDVPMIIIADPEHCSTIEQLREPYKARTLVIPIAFEALPYHKYTELTLANRKKNPIKMLNDVKDTLNYQILNWSKPWLVEQAIRKDPFNSTHYIWNDFGMPYMADMSHVQEDSVYSHQTNKIRYMENRVLNPTLVADWKEYFKEFHWNFAGTMFRGPKQLLLWFREEFDKTLTEILQAGFAPLEQEVFPVIVSRHSDKFESYCGDYRSVVANYKYARLDAWLLLLYAREALKFRQWDKLKGLGRMVLLSHKSQAFGGSKEELAEILDLYFESLSLKEREELKVYCRHLLSTDSYVAALKKHPRLVY